MNHKIKKIVKKILDFALNLTYQLDSKKSQKISTQLVEPKFECLLFLLRKKYVAEKGKVPIEI